MVANTEETMPLRALAAVTAVLLAASPLASASAQEWPSRPVKIIECICRP
jgi:tripartite-type tricarboxylate transporter receptor subunit TctC